MYLPYCTAIYVKYVNDVYTMINPFSPTSAMTWQHRCHLTTRKWHATSTITSLSLPRVCGEWYGTIHIPVLRLQFRFFATIRSIWIYKLPQCDCNRSGFHNKNKMNLQCNETRHFSDDVFVLSKICHFRSLHRRPSWLSCINEYLAVDSGGNVSDLVVARNCCIG